MNKPKITFAFGKENYVLMVIGLIVIIIGLLLMSGGASQDPTVFNEKEIFSFRRITLAPIVCLIGYAIELVAILYKSKEK
jgi:hypothetical protein